MFVAAERFELVDMPLPSIEGSDMLIEVDLCGVDGSELHMFHGEMAWCNATIPAIFGDEIIGRVVSIGHDAKAARNLDIGDRVTVEARWPCSSCETPGSCHYFICERNTTGRGYGTITAKEAPGLWGGYATHVYVPAEVLVYRLPDALHDKAALVACSVLANGLRWSQLAEAAPGKRVAVVGPGPQGLACALAAAELGAEVLVIGLEHDGPRLEMARRLGARHVLTIGGNESVEDVCNRARAIGPIDSVIETAGVAAAKQLTYGLVRRSGRIVNVSVPKPIAQPVDWLDLLIKEVTILNPMSHPHYVDKALNFATELMAKGIDVGDLVTHVFSLDQAERAIRTAAFEFDDQPIKVVLDPRKPDGFADRIQAA
jgi:threonine dehydrogenase-like Zn-dependent dehydrogenase